MNDIVQKGGEVSEKNQILNVLLKVTFKEICKKCLWYEMDLEDVGFILVISSNQNFHLSLLR